MNELLREIEEDIRQERAQKLWKSFGRLAVGASIAVIVITIVTVIWQERRQTHAMTQTSQFIKGLDRLKLEDYQGAIQAFDELAGDPSSPYYGLAMLRKAEAQTLSGDAGAAKDTYLELSEKGRGKNEAFTGLAKILADESPEKADKDSPFYYAEREWEAWKLIEKNKTQEAIALFTALRDDAEAPYAIRSRAKMVTEHLSPEAGPATQGKP